MNNHTKRISRIADYGQFATDFAVSSELQREAQSWLEVPMLEVDEKLSDHLSDEDGFNLAAPASDRT